MRKTIVLGGLLILLQLPLLAYLLLAERTWGGKGRDGASGVAVAGDGSVYVTGETQSFGEGGGDAFLLKYSATSRLLWRRTYGTAPDPENSGAEAGIDVAVAPDNGIVVLGNYRDGNIFLAKFNSDGELVWDLTWGSGQEGASAIDIAPDGTIYVAGVTFGFDLPQGDAFLLRFSSAGQLDWQRTWGGEFFDAARGVAVATDGNIFISGDTIFSSNSAFLVKFAPDGSVIWEREWGLLGGSPDDDQTVGNAVAAAPDGGAYVAGGAFGVLVNRNLVAVHFDAAGNFVWQSVGGPGFGAAEDLAVGPDGRIHVSGTVLSEPSGGNAFVWTLNPKGKGKDAALWGGDDPFQPDTGASIAVTPEGAIVVAGVAGEAPYAFSNGRSSAKRATTFLSTITGTVTTPAGVVGNPAAIVNTVGGRQTFAGETDAFLIRVEQ